LSNWFCRVGCVTRAGWVFDVRFTHPTKPNWQRTSAGERKSSYHPLVQRIWGHHSVPRNPIFPKNRISGWYGNLCFPALGNVLAKVALSDSMIWPSMAVILNKGGLLIQLWLWRNPIFPKNRISWRYGNLCFPALEAIPSNDPSAQTHVWHEMQK